MTYFGQGTVIKLIGGELLQRDPLAQDVTLRTRLLGIKARALNLEPPFRAFLPEWMAYERQVFASQGLPHAWPRLSPLYRAWKAKHFPGKTILRRTDRLYRSLTSPGGENIAIATPRTIKFGSRVRHFGYHQSGTGTMPARPPLVMLPAWFRALNKKVMTYVLKVGYR